MKWSFSIGRIFGIDLRIHLTFFLIVVLGAMQWSKAGAAGMAFGAGFVLLLFLCVVLHELGHSVVALRFGIPVHRIVLLPIGGVAMMGRPSAKPLHELLIAIAGPAVNVVIIAVLLGLSAIFPHALRTDLSPLQAGVLEPSAGLMIALLITVNAWLIVFNMIPAFPLDGGRVFRAALWFFMPNAKATRIAATVGQVAALGMGIWGLMSGQIMLTVIAFFIFMGAGAESADTQARAVLETERVGDAYNKTATTLTLNDRVSTVVDRILTSYQPDFAVVHRGQLLGVVTRDDVLKHLAANTYDVCVTEVMREDIPHVSADLTLQEVRQRLADAQARVAAVFDRDYYLGLVSNEDIAEAYVVLSYLRQNPRGLHHAPTGTRSPAIAEPQQA